MVQTALTTERETFEMTPILMKFIRGILDTLWRKCLSSGEMNLENEVVIGLQGLLLAGSFSGLGAYV